MGGWRVWGGGGGRGGRGAGCRNRVGRLTRACVCVVRGGGQEGPACPTGMSAAYPARPSHHPRPPAMTTSAAQAQRGVKGKGQGGLGTRPPALTCHGADLDCQARRRVHIGYDAPQHRALGWPQEGHVVPPPPLLQPPQDPAGRRALAGSRLHTQSPHPGGSLRTTRKASPLPSAARQGCAAAPPRPAGRPHQSSSTCVHGVEGCR